MKPQDSEPTPAPILLRNENKEQETSDPAFASNMQYIKQPRSSPNTPRSFRSNGEQRATPSCDSEDSNLSNIKPSKVTHSLIQAIYRNY